jgi:hypothetical protein
VGNILCLSLRSKTLLRCCHRTPSNIPRVAPVRQFFCSWKTAAKYGLLSKTRVLLSDSLAKHCCLAREIHKTCVLLSGSLENRSGSLALEMHAFCETGVSYGVRHINNLSS